VNANRGKQFYNNFIDLNTNVDPAARRQRQAFDSNLRSVPQPAQEKFLQTQNAVLKQKIKEMQKEKADRPSS